MIMETAYDWITVAIFAGLVVLFMQRSVSDEPENSNDSIWPYLGAGLGCAGTNYLGNEGYHLLAIPSLIATVLFVVKYLKPFALWPKR
jgi:hypothetical protein